MLIMFAGLPNNIILQPSSSSHACHIHYPVLHSSSIINAIVSTHTHHQTLSINLKNTSNPFWQSWTVQDRGQHGFLVCLGLHPDATRLHPSPSPLPAWVWNHISPAGTQAATIHHRSPLLLEAQNAVFPSPCLHHPWGTSNTRQRAMPPPSNSPHPHLLAAPAPKGRPNRWL
ncbi:hypothetical protein LY78DRAFT_103779 [Colletotrichum sublineola]|nr:hypothetical protein LY78DRAFT_103779 [Colletotrichum sublineola]